MPLSAALVFLCLWSTIEPRVVDALAKAELRKLEGVWSISSLEVDGIAVPERDRNKFTLTIKGDKYSLSLGSGNRMEFQIHLNPLKKPKQIRLTRSDGSSYEGIYQLEGKSFLLCRPMGDSFGEKFRPDEFASKRGSFRLLFKFERK